jgi:ATP-dependent Lhr-like helicase
MRWGPAPSDTDRRAALARSLLDRYGVVTREVAHAESLEGGFSSVYQVLKAMEAAGRVRRGYFVAGHGGVQFALPGADEDLRARRNVTDAERALLLSAVDPANPYGALLPWPAREADREGSRLARVSGAFVLLFQGDLAGYFQKSGGTLTTFGEEPSTHRDRACAAALVAWASAQPLRRAFQLSLIDGLPAARHRLAPAFQEAGFVAAGGGLLLALHRRAGDPAIPEAEPESEEADAGG